MNKHDLAIRLARESHKSRASAADEVDNLVYQMLKELRKQQKKEEGDPAKISRVPSSDSQKENP